jgi:hypothetical protein
VFAQWYSARTPHLPPTPDSIATALRKFEEIRQSEIARRRKLRRVATAVTFALLLVGIVLVLLTLRHLFVRLP